MTTTTENPARRILATVLLAGALVAISGNAGAGAPDTMYEPRSAFAATDANHDGQIDLKEFLDRIDDVFYAADVGKDGLLGADELAQLPFAGDFKKTETSGDGRLTLYEYEMTRVHAFERADTNKDGTLSLDEVVAAYEGRAKK